MTGILNDDALITRRVKRRERECVRYRLERGAKGEGVEVRVGEEREGERTDDEANDSLSLLSRQKRRGLTSPF